MLFHGTGRTEPSVIYNGDIGFDMRYSDSGMWGRGTYFAVNASYSVNYSSTEAATGSKQFFLARVLLGDHCEVLDSNPRPDVPSRTQLRKPPARHDLDTGAIEDTYDSVKGYTGGSDVYIVYQNNQGYPEYLITYD